MYHIILPLWWRYLCLLSLFIHPFVWVNVGVVMNWFDPPKSPPINPPSKFASIHINKPPVPTPPLEIFGFNTYNGQSSLSYAMIFVWESVISRLSQVVLKTERIGVFAVTTILQFKLSIVYIHIFQPTTLRISVYLQL